MSEPREYTIADIQVLKELEAVRRRPGMYIGSTDRQGLHRLVYEIVYNSVDEFLAGSGNQIRVHLLKDGWIKVTDNGRGIPVEIHPDTSISGVETVFTRLHAGAKFGSKAYTITGGLHGVGASVVNALSSQLKVEVRRNGKVYRQEYRRGKPITPLKEVKGSQEQFATGTAVAFLADKSVFGEVKYDFDTIAQRLKELAYLNPGLRLELEEELSGRKAVFFFDSGIAGLVKEFCQGKTPLHPEPVYLSGEIDHTKIEVALQYCQEADEDGYSFANCINTSEGGSHLSGFRAGLTRAINDFARKNKLLKEKEPNLQGEDVREGLNFVLSVYLPEPQFEGQTKARLSNQEIKGQVEAIVYEKLTAWLEGHPVEAKRVIERSLEAARVREAARRMREARKKAWGFSVLPGKLADCSEKEPERCELFIVEGESAGGSAKSARDRHFQAILPLRGKILNVEKASVDKILKHEEIQAIKLALRVDNNDLSRLRYHRVIIMCDADVDGSHIRTLLLTFFYRQMPELIRQGHLYIAQPPLYRVQSGKEVFWVYSEEEKEACLKKLKGRVEVQRYKGLGEMNPEQLWQTTLNPRTRTLFKIELKDAQEAERLFRLLMGEEVPPRRQFIFEYADKVRNLDI